LGKTLQAVTLIWTLMTQSPTGEATVKRTLVVCPSSLVGNWVKEFNKWLGPGAIDAIPFGDANKKKAKKALAHWAQSREVRTNVLVASYDQMRIHIKEIQAISRVGSFISVLVHRPSLQSSLLFFFLKWKI
jgi:SNF2 family DNA or RNA helicase